MFWWWWWWGWGDAQINPELDVYCQGGSEPPRNCKNKNYKTKNDYTGCVCLDGFYEPDAATGCTPCPAGHKCVDGNRTVCPMHTYQPNTGATACFDCVASRDGDGVYSDCGRNQQLMWCQQGKATPLPDNCVPCTRCRKAYLTRDAEGGQPDTVDCYRSNAF